MHTWSRAVLFVYLYSHVQFVKGTYETRNRTESIGARANFNCSVSSVLNGY